MPSQTQKTARNEVDKSKEQKTASVIYRDSVLGPSSLSVYVRQSLALHAELHMPQVFLV